ncbi:methyltransferase [Amycolatopsis samaneae]|uniref:Methyltransferase n=1 Tax=Amycolatopsis samaneae TaxID=664691 RepID=A0ABW5GRP7_9PSEU
MSEERATKIWELHQSLVSRGSAGAECEQTFSFLGLTITVPPQVLAIGPVSYLLGEAVLAETGSGDRVLDMGTGNGVNGVLAATKGAEVLAVDINPHALEAARGNADRNGVGDRFEVRHSDIFSAVDGAFDLIIFNPPFRWFAAGNVYESATTDENYAALTRFFRQARKHLTGTGRVLIFFGTGGDLDYLHQLADEEGFRRETVSQHSRMIAGMQVDFVTYRLS